MKVLHAKTFICEMANLQALDNGQMIEGTTNTSFVHCVLK